MDDDLLEQDEEIAITLAVPSNAPGDWETRKHTFTLTIFGNDGGEPAIGFATDSSNVAEGDAEIAMMITDGYYTTARGAKWDATNATVAAIATADDARTTATATTDYATTSGTFTRTRVAGGSLSGRRICIRKTSFRT